MRGYIVFAAVLALAGCEGSPARELLMGSEAVADADDAKCRGMGATPGSDVYVQCRMLIEQNRQARRAEVRQSLADLSKPPPAPQTIVVQPAPVRCTSNVWRNTVNTNCY